MDEYAKKYEKKLKPMKTNEIESMIEAVASNDSISFLSRHPRDSLKLPVIA